MRNTKTPTQILPRVVVFGFALILRSCLFPAGMLVAVTVLSGLLPGAEVYLGKLLVDTFVVAFQSEKAGAGLVKLLALFGLQATVLVVGATAGQWESYLNFATGRRLSFFMQGDVLQRATRVSFRVFDEPGFQDAMTRAQQECSGRPLSLLNQATSVTRGIITFLCLSGILLSFGWSLFALSLVACLPLLLVQLKYGQRRYQLQRGRTEDQRRSGYYAALLLSKYARPEICSYGLCDFLFARWITSAQRFLNQDMQLQRQQVLAQAAVQALLALAGVGVTAYIAFVGLTKRSDLTVGDVLMFSGSFAGALVAFRSVSTGIAGLYQDSLFLSNLLHFHQMAPTVAPVPGGRRAPDRVESVAFDKVSFTYPGRRQPALKHVTIVFERAHRTLLVGANGAGKTTLMKLLLRLYDPTEGRILLNGVDLREYDVRSLRERIGVVFQHLQPYAFSARENIGCGRVERMSDEARIAAAAHRARADEFIRELPDRYDTPLTRTFTGGQDLSVGQWQRICLARLFMKDAPVLVLDEPTASLDVETEAALLAEIRAGMSAEKLCIFISHRLFRPGLADHIVVLSRGTVLEEGGYDDLVASHGEFARLRALSYENGGVASA